MQSVEVQLQGTKQRGDGWGEHLGRIAGPTYNGAFPGLFLEVDITVNSSPEAQSSSAICEGLHSSSVARSGLELRSAGSIPVLSPVPGHLPPPTPAYQGESLLILLASGFFLRTRRPGGKELSSWAGE